MGNCHAAEAATVVVQHPGNGKVERIYRSVTAKEVMSSNPGYYVALVVERSDGHVLNKPTKNHLKLLRPDDTLHIGHVYRLVSFEDVVNEFTLKKSEKLGKLLKGSGVLGVDKKDNWGAFGSNLDNGQRGRDNDQFVHDGSGSRGVGRHHPGGGEWRPALQSIAEL